MSGHAKEFWYRYFDENYECYYFVNGLTGLTQWEDPSTNVAVDIIDQTETVDFHTLSESPLHSTYQKNCNIERQYEHIGGSVEEESITFAYYPPLRSDTSENKHGDIDKNSPSPKRSSVAYNYGFHDETITYSYYGDNPTVLRDCSVLTPVLLSRGRRDAEESADNEGDNVDEPKESGSTSTVANILPEATVTSLFDRHPASDASEQWHGHFSDTIDEEYATYGSDSHHGGDSHHSAEELGTLVDEDMWRPPTRGQCLRSRPGDSDAPSATAATAATGGKNQDYLNLARMYKLERPYADPGYKALCVLCRKNYACDVFFPCQHRCVCRECISSEHICDDRGMASDPKGYCNCSLCGSVIKLILPNEGGAEVQRYWDWVYEEKVELPPRFLKDFRHSAAVIEAVYVNDGARPAKIKGGRRRENSDSNVCKMS